MKKIMYVTMIFAMFFITIALTIFNIKAWSNSTDIPYWIISVIIILLTLTPIIASFYKNREDRTRMFKFNIEDMTVDERSEYVREKASSTTMWIFTSILIIGGLSLCFLKVNDPNYFMMGFYMVLMGVSELLLFFVTFIYYYHKY